MTTTAIARKVALATQDAYSYDRYGSNAWLATAKWMAKQGLNEQEIEAMLRSKHTRWAMDAAGDKGKSKAFENYAASATNCGWFNLKVEAKEMARQTFGE